MKVNRKIIIEGRMRKPRLEVVMKQKQSVLPLRMNKKVRSYMTWVALYTDLI